MKRLIIFLLIVVSSLEFAFSQSHFSKVWSGNGVDQMNFYAMSATINGENLQNGDEIAVFDGGYCVGVAVVTGSGMVSIEASKDDPVTVGIVDGFRVGNTASFKIWDDSKNIEVTDINVDVVGGTIVFEPSGSAFVNLTGTVACTNPSAPAVGTITQPTCAVSTGSVDLSGLPGSGSWTLTRTPGGTTYSNSGTSYTVTGLPAGDTYTFTVTNESACTSGASNNVPINAQPVIPVQPVTISGSSEVCQGTSQMYSISAVTGATSYSWTLPSGWTGTSTTTSITATVGAAGGDVSVTANNACGSSVARTLAVTVTTSPAQPGTISGNTPVCQATLQTYSISPVAGATSYTWTLPSGWTGSSTSASINATVGATSGDITITATNSCGTSTPRSLSVTVTPTPAQPGAITGPATVCQGSSPTYSISAVTGATSYTWTLPSGWSGTSTTTSITATAGAAGGDISVLANNACGSGTVRTLTVTVSTIPLQPGTISGSTTVCQGGSQAYSISAVTGATSYTWTLPSGWTGTSTTASITATVGAAGGDISVTANNACGNSTARALTVTVTTVPAQPGTITGDDSPCQGSSQTFSISAVPGATSYTWTLPSGWTGTSTTTSITATASATSGNISVAANNACGAGTTKTLSVTVTALPAQPGAITGPATVCQGSSQTYSISAVTGATSYTWTLPSGWSGTSTSTSITATAGAAGGDISVLANNACGSGTVRTLTVTVSTIPLQPGTISGSTTVCQGGSQAYSISAVTGATSYTWTLPSGWTGTSTTASITATVGAAGGDISVTANNACGNSTARALTVTVTTVPAQPGTITGDDSPCQGSSQTFSISAVPGATSYTWTLPSGWTGTSTTTSITATASATSGNISVAANNACGAGTAKTLSVTVTALPAQPGAITGTATVCQGSSQTYSISAVTGATSYTWTLPSGWSGTSTSTSITATVGAAGGDISVLANNACGGGIARILSVTVATMLPQPGAITGNTVACQSSSLTYSITAVAGATSYIWTLPSGWTGSSSTSSITATIGAAGGDISVAASNACGISTARILSVTVASTPAQPGTISGNATVCQGSSQTYSISAVTGATSYTWTLPSGWSGSSTSVSINATAGATSGNVTVAANNTCGSGTAKALSVTVNALPAQPGMITGSSAVCQGSSQTYSISAVAGATSYTWSLPSGWSGSSTSTSITTTAGANGGDVSVMANNACGSGIARILAVTVAVNPAQPGTITGSASVCQGSSQTYSISAVAGVTSYSWTLPSGWTGSSTATSITATAGVNDGDVSVTANNACGISTARKLSVTVAPTPAQPGSISGNDAACQGSLQTYSISPVDGASSYTWTLPSGWTGSSASASITATVGANSGNISVAANNTCGSGSARSLNVSVTALPLQPGIVTGNENVCVGSIQTYSIPGVTGATSYTWTLPSGWIGSSTSTSITTTAGASGGYINVAANNTCGSGIARTVSVASSEIPSAPIIETITDPTCTIATGSAAITGLPVSGSWILTRIPDGTTYEGSGTHYTVAELPAGATYNFTVSNTSDCVSEASTDVAINTQSESPSVPVVDTVIQPTCAEATGSIGFEGLPATGTWTLTNSQGGATITGSGTIAILSGLATGTCAFTVTNSAGCISAKCVDIIINDQPFTPSAPTVDTIIHPSGSVLGSVVLNDLPSEGTWTLIINQGELSSEGTGSIYTIPDLAAGTYSFMVTNESGCSSGEVTAILATITGLQKNELDNAIIYPNPTREFVTILFEDQQGRNIDIQITTLQGKVVIENRRLITDSGIELNIKDLPSGLYFIRVNVSGHIRTFKIAKN